MDLASACENVWLFQGKPGIFPFSGFLSPTQVSTMVLSAEKPLVVTQP